MKIPTQQNNLKRTTLVVAGMAVMTGLAIPSATFAQGQNGNRAGEGSSWNRGDHRGGKHGNFNRDSMAWWEKISADDFNKWNTAKLDKIDSYLEKNNLQVENGDVLRSAVETNTVAVADNLRTLEDLRESTGAIETATEEQRVALKEQTVATFSSYYDYKLSMFDYTAAIKAIATNNGVKLDGSIKEEEPESAQ